MSICVSTEVFPCSLGCSLLTLAPCLWMTCSRLPSPSCLLIRPAVNVWKPELRGGRVRVGGAVWVLCCCGVWVGGVCGVFGVGVCVCVCVCVCVWVCVCVCV